ncbi:MAG: O-antigen ligase family protein [Fibrobacter sp.]|nr:O-antigen ligase family protein [Fibrobacter sp.]
MVIFVGPLNFYSMRIFVLIGMVRVLVRREYKGIHINKIDKCMILWVIVMLITGAIREKIDTTFITRLGVVYDNAGIYFLMRFLLQSKTDIYAIIKTLAVVMFVLTLFMLYEKVNRYNLFHLLGGKFIVPAIRDGRVRCQGPFGHSILAGTVAATISTWFFVSFWNKSIDIKYAILGFFSTCMIVFLSASSGPIMSLFFALIAFAFWPLRDNMKAVRFAILCGIVFLLMTMKAPIWFLISKIDLTGSSTGWHRSELIDSAIRHFNEWWLIGTPITRHWMPSGVGWSPYQTDITNQYIRNGVDGGLLGMLLFIFMISNGYKLIGKSLRKINEEDNFLKIILWAIGSSLFSHTATFFSVAYFDQTIMYFYLTLALIGCIEQCDIFGKTGPPRRFSGF